MDASRCRNQNLSRGALLQAGMAAECCNSAAARQPDQAAIRLKRPLFTSPKAQGESLGHSQQPQSPSKAQSSELEDLGNTGWASEHDVITAGSWQPPLAGVNNPHITVLEEDDDIDVVDELPSSSITRSSSAETYDDAALSPSTPSPRVSLPDQQCPSL